MIRRSPLGGFDADASGTGRGGCSRYDLVLAAIPSAFLVAAVLGTVIPVGMHTMIGIASIVGLSAVVDALFLNPPRGPRTGRPAS